MRGTHRQPLAAFLAVALSIATACDDPVEPVAPGSIEIVMVTSGQDIMTSNLRVTVGDAIVRSLDSAQAITIDVMPGVHTIRLEGMSDNCQITSTNPRSVSVESRRITVVTFAMACTARTGSVRVTTTTAGPDADADGYLATVVGGPSLVVASSGTITLDNVREGQWLVTLGGVANNCAIAGADTSAVTVTIGVTADVGFTVDCVASGSLEVTVATTGTDPDPDGYLLDVRSTLVGFERVVSVAPNASATFPSLRPASDYRVTLQGGAANCVAASTVRTVAVNAGSATTVTFDIACEPAELLAFVRDGDIYAIASNGSGATRLTTDPDADGNPAWSSTGLIAFTTQRHNGDPELYVMSADGTNQVRLTTSAGTDGSPSWSVNGGKLVFSSARGLNSEVYTINVDGTGLTRLTTNDAYDDQPAWSSTGKIAFVSDRDHFAGEIYVMNEDGSNVVRLTHNEAAETGPVWSPDGSMIAFARQVDCYYYCQSDLFVMAADGSAERLLATGGSAVYYADPSWSPNGQAIAVTQQYCPWYCESPTIQIVDMQGNQRLLIDGAFDPSWRP